MRRRHRTIYEQQVTCVDAYLTHRITRGFHEEARLRVLHQDLAEIQARDARVTRGRPEADRHVRPCAIRTALLRLAAQPNELWTVSHRPPLPPRLALQLATRRVSSSVSISNSSSL